MHRSVANAHAIKIRVCNNHKRVVFFLETFEVGRVLFFNGFPREIHGNLVKSREINGIQGNSMEIIHLL